MVCPPYVVWTVMSSPALPEWLARFTNTITDGTPVGNNGLVQSLLCKQCQSKHPVVHGGGGEQFLQLVK